METDGPRSTDSRPETAALEVANLSKGFGPTRALSDVSIRFREGAVTALLGPNGCGKSTLIKILAGVHDPDAGSRVLIRGEVVATPIAARESYDRGLRFVHQDLGLVGDMTVADNLCLANAFDATPKLAPIPRSVRRLVREALEPFELDIDPRTPVRELGKVDQIMVAIVRAFRSTPAGGAVKPIVILDEPTASLPLEEVGRVLTAVRGIKNIGGTVLYVTHRIDEVFRIADDAVVLRDGKVAGHALVDIARQAELISLITGGSMEQPVRRHREATEKGIARLVVHGLTGPRLADVSFEVGAGEIVGVTGLAGCGRSELARIVGGSQRPTSGSVWVEGAELGAHSPAQAIKQGVMFVPPDRTREGCIPSLTIRENLSLANVSRFWSAPAFRHGTERRHVAELLEIRRVKPRDPEARMQNLSGGNQQKTIIARFAQLDPRVLVLDEPTQAVDLNGKAEIAVLIQELAEQGCSILLCSSDLDEIAYLCDRVLLLDRGRLVGAFAGDTVHEEQVAMLASTAHRGDAA